MKNVQPMKPWKGWCIVEKATGQPTFWSLLGVPAMHTTKADATAWLRNNMHVDAESHRVVRVTISASVERT